MSFNRLSNQSESYALAAEIGIMKTESPWQKQSVSYPNFKKRRFSVIENIAGSNPGFQSVSIYFT